MNEYTINEVLEYARDLEEAWKNKDDLDAFNQAVMRLADASSNLVVVDNFDDVN